MAPGGEITGGEIPGTPEIDQSEDDLKILVVSQVKKARRYKFTKAAFWSRSGVKKLFTYSNEREFRRLTTGINNFTSISQHTKIAVKINA